MTTWADQAVIRKCSMSPATEGRSRGLAYILTATAVAGAAGYAIQLAAPALIHDATAYLAFSVFWSTLYLFVAAVAGVQQEVTRATRPSAGATSGATLRNFTLVAASVVALAAAATGVLIAPVAFSPAPAGVTMWFVVGIVGYLLTAVLAGVLYGLELWRAIAALTVIDATVRGLAVLVALYLQAPAGVIAAVIALPFVFAFGTVWLGIRRSVVGRFALDVSPRRLSQNALGTVVAAAATGVMVNGLPLLLRTGLPDAAPVTLAGLILILTVTRAPLIVPLMALQSFLIVDFRGAGERLWPRLRRYMALLAVAAAAATIAAWFLGPWFVDTISAGRYAVDSLTSAGVVASAGMVALMCLTGPALLSAGRHKPYVSGWVVAAALTVGLLLLPLDTVTATLLAVLAAPAVGLAVHLVTLRVVPVRGALVQ